MALQPLAAQPHVEKVSEPAKDWHLLKTVRCNVLVSGGRDWVEQVLVDLSPCFGTPVYWWTQDTVLPKANTVMTLIIRDVASLSASQQRELALWLEQSISARVVSATTVCLFDLMAAGLFSEVLYYRLNTWLVDAGQPAGLVNGESSDHDVTEPTAIANRAFGLYLSRGCVNGHDLDDWLQAERELGVMTHNL